MSFLNRLLFAFALLFPALPIAAQDSTKLLLNDPVTQFEVTESLNDLYNFKFDKAEEQFSVLRKRFPDHPMPYFLYGLAAFWKIIANEELHTYDERFLLYMDSTISFGEKMYDDDKKNYEVIFFLCAANGLKGRFYSDRGHWTRGTIAGKNALHYLHKGIEIKSLSPEFLFGEGLYNYYEEWLRENYPGLRPVLWFFPNGNKAKGLSQLKESSENAFYCRTEAQVFLMRILAVEEGRNADAMPIARHLYNLYPDNPFLERFYARCLFQSGQQSECFQVSQNILRKIDAKQTGYDAASGRYAAFYLAWYLRNSDTVKAKEYFQKTLRFSEEAHATQMGYYFYSLAGIAKIADGLKQFDTAKKYYGEVVKRADKYHPSYIEAKKYLKNNEK